MLLKVAELLKERSFMFWAEAFSAGKKTRPRPRAARQRGEAGEAARQRGGRGRGGGAGSHGRAPNLGEKGRSARCRGKPAPRAAEAPR